MTVVRQEAVLFHDSLRNNLTMYQDIPDKKLIEMLQTLGLIKFAGKEALDGMIAENGANLSGGEKKRICLARALLRDTDILILDEPLANLDDTTAGMIEDLLLSIEGKLRRNRCSNTELRTFTGHMGRNDLINYYADVDTPRIALVHGDADAKIQFAADLEAEMQKRNRTGRAICVNKGTQILL